MEATGARERLYRAVVADEVAAAVRHGLVNKLAGVGALAFLLRRQLSEGESAATGTLALLDAELGKATAMLDLHYLEPPRPDPPPLPLAAAVAETVRTYGPRPAGVALLGPAPHPATVLVDAAELDLALVCLLDNACEAVAERGGRVAARIAEVPAPTEGPMIAVEVADDGPGLSSEVAARARERFFTTRPGRLGLGLTITARIAQRARGHLILDDAATGSPGAVARLVLPRGPG
jgi:C4-dicarboxylate-specific signal transduction histidine kinase